MQALAWCTLAILSAGVLCVHHDSSELSFEQNRFSNVLQVLWLSLHVFPEYWQSTPKKKLYINSRCADSWFMGHHKVFKPSPCPTYISKHLCLHVLTAYYDILWTLTTYIVYKVYGQGPKLRITKVIVSKSYRFDGSLNRFTWFWSMSSNGWFGDIFPFIPT